MEEGRRLELRTALRKRGRAGFPALQIAAKSLNLSCVMAGPDPAIHAPDAAIDPGVEPEDDGGVQGPANRPLHLLLAEGEGHVDDDGVAVFAGGQRHGAGCGIVLGNGAHHRHRFCTIARFGNLQHAAEADAGGVR